MKNNRTKLLATLGGCLVAIIVLFVIMGNNIQLVKPAQDAASNDKTAMKTEPEDEMAELTITINDQKFKLQLANTEAAKEFAAATPFELEMKDLNQNEKYYYGESLPVAEYDVKNIHTGDLMLYEDNCIVLFYKDFETTYRYTKLGKIVDTAGLVEAVGTGNVTLIFTKQ